MEDLILSCSKLAVRYEIKSKITSTFKMTDLGELSMEVHLDRPNRRLENNQTGCFDNIFGEVRDGGLHARGHAG